MNTIHWPLIINLLILAILATITILVNARILYFYNKTKDPVQALTTLLNKKDTAQNIEELFNDRG